ncbi:MAG: M20 family peptidase [Rhodoblastus sp.]
MKWAFRTLGALALLAGALLAIMAWRAFGASPQQANVTPAPKPGVDIDAAARRLAGAVRIKTISWDARPDASGPEFLALHDYLEQNFPNAHRAMKREKIGEFSLLYTWQGSDPALKPIMLMAHQDVVPIAPGTENNWLHEPFSGDIADGFVWGRGAWDDKSNLMALFEAVEMLAAAGAHPRRTIYIASGHDEEVGGMRGATQIAKLLDRRGVKLEFVLDEGMIVTQGVVPGIEKPVALIGLAEKGMTSVSISSEGAPGHSSMPPARSRIGEVAEALHKLETNQMPARLQGVARQSMEALAPHMGGLNRLILANLWITEPLARNVLARTPASAAMLRTTTALTVFNAGEKSNVLPARATALVNYRVAPGDTIEGVMQHVRYTIGNPLLKTAVFGVSREPSPVSPSDSGAYRLIERTIRETMPEAIIAPGLVIAGTDSRQMSGLTPNVYRFLPVRAGPEDLPRFHGTNERMGIENYGETIAFFHRLMNVSAVEGKSNEEK